MALALNRYLCLAVLPLITKCAPLFAGTEHRAIMVDSMLHTVYRLSRGRSLTKAQRDVIEDCLMALCRWGGARGAGGAAGVEGCGRPGVETPPPPLVRVSAGTSARPCCSTCCGAWCSTCPS